MIENMFVFFFLYTKTYSNKRAPRMLAHGMAL